MAISTLAIRGVKTTSASHEANFLSFLSVCCYYIIWLVSCPFSLSSNLCLANHLQPRRLYPSFLSACCYIAAMLSTAEAVIIVVVLLLIMIGVIVLIVKCFEYHSKGLLLATDKQTKVRRRDVLFQHCLDSVSIKATERVWRVW